MSLMPVASALASLDAGRAVVCVDSGRSAIAPARLIHASLQEILLSVRRHLEQLQNNLAFRWFAASASSTSCGSR